MKNLLFTLIIVISWLPACTKDKGPIEPVVPVTTVSFTQDVQSIFNDNCIACHNTEQQANNGHLNLEAAVSYQNLVGVASNAYTLKRVVSGKADQSLLYKKINESMEYGANMPLGGNLSKTAQEKIRVWITEGALDN